MKKLCSVLRCGRYCHAGGFCHGHYVRYKKHGDPQAHIPIGSVDSISQQAVDTWHPVAMTATNERLGPPPPERALPVGSSKWRRWIFSTDWYLNTYSKQHKPFTGIRLRAIR